MTIDRSHTEIVNPGARNPRREAEIAAGMFLAGYSSETTRRSYQLDMRLWFGFLDENDVVDPVHDVRRSHVEVFLRLLEAKGLSPGTRARRLSTINMFYKYLVDEQYLVHSPCARVKRPDVPRVSARLHLGRHELSDWLDAAEAEGGYPYALACLLALNALRIGEVLNAQVEDMSVHRWHNVLNIMGKGSKPDTVPLPARTAGAIATALNGRTTGPLLLNKLGDPMRRDAASRIVRRFAKQAGVSRNITPHSLRHSAITAALNAGVDLRDVQSFARHEDPKTTIRYDRERHNLDRHPSYAVSQWLAGAA